MDAQLAAIVQDLQTVEQRLRRLHGNLARDAWHEPPAPGRWSPADCVVHLNLTSRAILPLLHEGVREAGRRRERSSALYRRDPVGWLVSKLIAPWNPLRTRTIRAFVPQGGELDTVMAEFSRLQAQVIACVHAADGLPIDRVKVRSPFDRRVKYNVYSALTLIPSHQLRHALQAEGVAHAPVAAGLPLVD